MVRHETLRRFPDHFFVTIHQTFETDLRQFVLAMNRFEYFFDVFQKTFSVRFRLLKHRQKLDLADQMSPAEPEKRLGLFSARQIRREEIAADAAEKILAK